MEICQKERETDSIGVDSFYKNWLGGY